MQDNSTALIQLDGNEILRRLVIAAPVPRSPGFRSAPSSAVPGEGWCGLQCNSGRPPVERPEFVMPPRFIVTGRTPFFRQIFAREGK